MKPLILLALLSFSILTASAQSAVNVRIISNDGSIQATNSITLSADKVSGLLSKWALDSKSKTNAGSAALTFNLFIFQELSDKGTEWTLQAGRDAIKLAGVTNNIPDKAALAWSGFTTNQQAAVVSFLNNVPQ